MKQTISISIGLLFFFFITTTISAILEFLGNAEAIKLSKINLLEAIEKHFYYSTNSYLFGSVCVLIGVFIYYNLLKKGN